MRVSTSLCGLALAAMTLAAAPATAQLRDLDPRSIEAATKYALPIAFDSYVQKCAAELDPGGYVFANEMRLYSKFAEASEGAWPEARAALLKAASKEAEGGDALLAAMPDEALKPFVDGIFRTMVESEIKADQCTDIERGLELLDPMPVDNIAGLLGFIIELDNKSKATELAEREATGE